MDAYSGLVNLACMVYTHMLGGLKSIARRKEKRVLIPYMIHKDHNHYMIPWNDLRKCECCKRLDAISDGYYCESCDFFVHKKCGDEASKSIQRPSHCLHTLHLRRYGLSTCNLCGRYGDLFYRCDICCFNMDLCCALYPPPKVIENSERHGHKLTLVKKRIKFDCSAKCGKVLDIELHGDKFPDGFHYKCGECDLAFHVDCVWHPSEVKHSAEINHSYHSLHPLKLLADQPPDYSDGKCRLCGRIVDDGLFYHCSSCDFTLDMRCVLHPPPQTVLDVKTHDHQLTLLLRLDSFTCNACGLKGDRSPYVCIQCDFMIHQDCLALPRVININRHDHRVYRTYVLGLVNSVCRVCHKKVENWTRGGYSCQRCPDYVVHSKCATRKDVWNGKELEGIPEEIEDIEPYVVIDANTIHHFSHKEHYLRLKVSGLLCVDNKRCNACTQPISLTPFYGCTMGCDFILHQSCAELPKRKRHVLHNERLTLVTSNDNYSYCGACGENFNGFMYQHGEKKFDVLCSSISEPFIHPSHPQHPLYYIPSEIDYEICNACNIEARYVLRCVEDGCNFLLDFQCATLPQEVKHRVEHHPLLLCYGEKASGKYWCDICEKETNPETWFYTCKDNRASLHTKCVRGDTAGFMPGTTIDPYDKLYDVVLNNSMSRPVCWWCHSRCIYPIIMKVHGTSRRYICSWYCLYATTSESRFYDSI